MPCCPPTTEYANLPACVPAAQTISADAKDFVTKLLDKEPRTRMTAARALNHKWLACAEQPVLLAKMTFAEMFGPSAASGAAPRPASFTNRRSSADSMDRGSSAAAAAADRARGSGVASAPNTQPSSPVPGSRGSQLARSRLGKPPAGPNSDAAKGAAPDEPRLGAVSVPLVGEAGVAWDPTTGVRNSALM